MLMKTTLTKLLINTSIAFYLTSCCNSSPRIISLEKFHEFEEHISVYNDYYLYYYGSSNSFHFFETNTLFNIWDYSSRFAISALDLKMRNTFPFKGYDKNNARSMIFSNKIVKGFENYPTNVLIDRASNPQIQLNAPAVLSPLR